MSGATRDETRIEPDWAVRRIDHVQITVPSGAEDAARGFYCGVLGLVEVDKPDALVGRGGLWLAIADQQIHIGTENDVDRTATKAHIAYEVGSLEPWRARLAGHGVEIIESVDIPGVERFEFRDPFGNRVEFLSKT